MNFINDEAKAALREENKQRIIDFLVKAIIGEIRDEYNDCDMFVQGETKQGGWRSQNVVSIQYFFDEKYRKVYLYYDIDKLTRLKRGQAYMYKRINAKLLNNFSKQTRLRLCLVGPASRLADRNYDNNTNYDSSRPYLRYSTFSYWETAFSGWQFIEDDKRSFLRYYNYLRPFINTDNSHINPDEHMKEYCMKVADINARYKDQDLHKHSVISKAFKEYADLNKEYFGKELKPIKQEDIVTLFIEIVHNEIKHKEVKP